MDQFNINSIILWPNADAGSSEIATEIRKYRENNKLQKSVEYFVLKESSTRRQRVERCSTGMQQQRKAAEVRALLKQKPK